MCKDLQYDTKLDMFCWKNLNVVDVGDDDDDDDDDDVDEDDDAVVINVVVLTTQINIYG